MRSGMRLSLVFAAVCFQTVQSVPLVTTVRIYPCTPTGSSSGSGYSNGTGSFKSSLYSSGTGPFMASQTANNLANATHAPNPPYLESKKYTAIGDSYAAGDGAYDRLPLDPEAACQRTESGYPYQFWQMYGSDLGSFNDVACSGAATEVVETEITSGSAIAAVPDITFEFGTPDIVSINVGGDNDEIFINTIYACVVALTDLDPTDPAYQQNCSDYLQTAVETINTIQPKLEAVYGHAKQQNLVPGQIRSVYVLGYAQFYNLETTAEACRGFLSTDIPVPPLGPDSIGSRINDLVLSMNDVIKKATLSQNVHYVDIDESFRGHRICDLPDDLVEFQKNGLLYYLQHNYAPFHPTTEGYASMMEDFAKAAGFT